MKATINQAINRVFVNVTEDCTNCKGVSEVRYSVYKFYDSNENIAFGLRDYTNSETSLFESIDEMLDAKFAKMSSRSKSKLISAIQAIRIK